MQDLDLCIKNIYPGIVAGTDYTLQDDGQGAYIKTWNYAQPQPTEAQLTAASLSVAKQLKIAALETSMNDTLRSGFTSSADGTSRTYGFSQTDQDNLEQQLELIVAGITAPTATISWRDKSENPVSLTVDQFKQLIMDAEAWKESNIAKLWNLEEQVKAATTEDAVAAIAWS